MAEKYDMRIEMGTDCAQTRAVRLVGTGKSVLELGCATGYVSRLLVEQAGCRVTGVDCNPEAAADARRFCERVILGDLDDLDYGRELGAERFDVILCGDVLEHLKRPDRTLAALRPFLRDGGYVVASIPNVAHASVVTELLGGHFSYRSWGLLDDTHLRFFTRDSIYACFERAGFEISYLDRLKVEPSETEFATDLSTLSAATARAVTAGEESRTYQFILVARPKDDAAAVPTRGRSRGNAVVVRPSSRGRAAGPGPGGLAAAQGRSAYLARARAQAERERDEMRRTVARHEEAVKAAHQFALRQQAELERQDAELRSRWGDIERLQREIVARDQDVERLSQEVGIQAEHLRRLRQEASGYLRDVQWLHREVATRDESLLQRQREADAREQEILRLGQGIAAQTREVERLHREVATRDESLLQRQREADAREQEILRLGQGIAAQTREVERLHREVATRDESLLERQREADAREEEVRRLCGEVVAREKDLARLHREVVLRDERLQQLAGQLSATTSALAAAEEARHELGSLIVVRLWRKLRRLVGQPLATPK
jgi:2-polyprenyl-3-methyl-5-hydroxy-6-metoxy-1,4-benzoquinol methylase